MEPEEGGYFSAVVEGVEPGAWYFYRLDNERERPDPASRFQPRGVHGPSQIVDHRFHWEDTSWSGLPLAEYILYELHAGAFTPEGTFDAIIPRLRQLKELGVTAVELMPVAQFPGGRNWGYDGVFPFAVQNSYGGPEGLKRLVNACHLQGLAVVLDVVYNHLGPEGNYFREFGHYFTDRYKTPWGPAINFDGPHSDEVRRFFVENALYWVTEFHIDALRLDAVHAILDHSAHPFLEDLAETVHQQAERLNRKIYAIPESALNDTRLIRSCELGGFGLDAQWNDDFHHALRALLTSDRGGYYQDFGDLRHLVKGFREGYVYSGEHSVYRKRRHGDSSRLIPAHQFVVFSQNHDQVGNRLMGERLSQLVPFEGLKLAAGAVLLSPFLPLLFMGEEYGETAPFLYFVSHSDPGLIETVRRGRKEEFAAFGWQAEPSDPQDETTFLRSKLNCQLADEPKHRALFDYYKELIRLRKLVGPLSLLSKDQMEVLGLEEHKTLCARRWRDGEEVFTVLYFGDAQVSVDLPIPAGRWRRLLDSSEERWFGMGSAVPHDLVSDGKAIVTLSPQACILFQRSEGS
jgi:maltooligosyltrehalose trehalohydrolase